MYKQNNGKFTEGIIWWDTKIDKEIDIDVYFFIHDFKGRAKYKYGFKSLEIDLNKSIEEIKNNYKPNLRNEIKNAKKMKFQIIINSKPKDEDIKEFVKIYNSFAKFKKLNEITFELLKSISQDNKLVLSKCIYNDEIIVQHSHYFLKDRTRLYHSSSTMNSLDGKYNGFANKLLTHEEIIFFKNKNIEKYDFGGIGNVDGDNSRFNGIIKFKKSFGGKEIILWKGITPNGKKGEEIYQKYWK